LLSLYAAGGPLRFSCIDGSHGNEAESRSDNPLRPRIRRDYPGLSKGRCRAAWVATTEGDRARVKLLRPNFKVSRFESQLVDRMQASGTRSSLPTLRELRATGPEGLGAWPDGMFTDLEARVASWAALRAAGGQSDKHAVRPEPVGDQVTWIVACGSPASITGWQLGRSDELLVVNCKSVQHSSIRCSDFS
jgi:hypothetical protein